MASDTDFGPPLRGGTAKLRHSKPNTPQRQRSPRRRRPGFVRGTLIAVLVLLLAIPVAGFALAVYANSRIDKVPVEGLASGGRPTNVLVVGSDSREGLSPEEQRELSTGREGGNLTDTIFVMTLGGGDAALLSFPRDLYVTRCDGSTGRINAAVKISGPGCLAETITTLSGIPIHHYLEVDFLGFRDIVDAVGGVELCLDRPISDTAAGIDLPQGCQHLGGRDALGFVRVRKIDNDLERIKRQQQFLKALAGEIAQPATLLRPSRLLGLARSGGAALTAQEGFGTIPMLRVAWGMRGLADGAPPTYTVPSTPTTRDGAAVLQPVGTEAQAVFDLFRSGDVLAERGSANEGLAPGDVTVTVLNGSGMGGLAATVADLLTDRGFRVADVGNADRTERTVVRYPPGQEAQARLVAGQAPGSVSVEESSDVSGVTLVLGRDAVQEG